MRAFVVRPFGVQEGIDFELVHSRLIAKALDRLTTWGIPIEGGTTGLIYNAGNIREDMFRLLAVSDLVIADVTIHNANAFYELGVRHALCPGSTQLIRARVSKFKYPFDLQTDRYFNYDLDNLEEGVEELAKSLRDTLANRKDSPIFLLLKSLKPHGRGDLVQVPRGFREAVQLARSTHRRGDLRLLAAEARRFEWDQEGLAMVGDAQFEIRAYDGAKETFELLRLAAPNDFHTNRRLATIYQRLALAASGATKVRYVTESNQAIERGLAVAETAAQKAELLSLQASNDKNRLTDDLCGDDATQRRRAALESPRLEKMLECYLRASATDCNAYYPAINALSFLKAQIELARQFPDAWEAAQDADPCGALQMREALAGRLAASLKLALGLDEVFKQFQAQSPPDTWKAASIAEFTLVSDPRRAPVITRQYRKANEGADRFTLEANRRNLSIFKSLELFEPGVSAALSVIDAELGKTAPPERPWKHALLFSGHRVDEVGRAPEQARFPRTKQAEEKARQLILDAVRSIVGSDSAGTVGIAGGASGGDILFHEVCAELGIETELYLALPEKIFQVESVEPGGGTWSTRFQALCELQRHKGIPELQPSRARPDWMTGNGKFNLWERNNRWLLFNTLATGAARRTLLAFYNAEREPDGPGGTEHLMELAASNGLSVVHVDARPVLK